MGNMGLEAAKGHVIQHYLLPACILANFHPCLTHRAYGQCQRKNHDTFPRFSSFLPLSARMTSKRPYSGYWASMMLAASIAVKLSHGMHLLRLQSSCQRVYTFISKAEK